MKRQAVTWHEERQKRGYNKRRRYSHYWRVRLVCGHFCNAIPVAGGDCPATVMCTDCGWEDADDARRA